MRRHNIKKVERVADLDADLEHYSHQEKYAAISNLLNAVMHYCSEHQINFWEAAEDGHQEWSREVQ